MQVGDKNIYDSLPLLHVDYFGEDLPKYLEYIIQICLMFCLARNQTMAILVKSYSCAGPNICTTPWNRRSIKK